MSYQWSTNTDTYSGSTQAWSEQGLTSITSITSAEVFDIPQLNFNIKSVTGIPTAEAFGSQQFRFNVLDLGISSVEAFGLPEIELMEISCSPESILTAEAVDAPLMKMFVDIDVTGIPSEEYIDNHWLTQNGFAQLTKDATIWGSQSTPSSTWTEETKQTANWS